MLHIHNLSPDHATAWTSCLQCLQPEDCLLLMDDAVLAALTPVLLTSLKTGQIPIYALLADWQARGLAEPPTEIQLVDFDGFVMLCESHYPIMTWR